MSQQVKYAVIDGANEEGLLNFLAEYNPPHSCLYAEPLQPELIALAPYLLEVTEEVDAWLATKTTPWGIYLYAAVMMKDLRQHLRKFLQIQIPGEENPVFFRFYDPRTVWDFFSVLTDWQIHSVMGPIDKIETVYEGTEREAGFEDVRKQFPFAAQSIRKVFALDQTQLDALNKQAEARYIAALTGATKVHYMPGITSVSSSAAYGLLDEERRKLTALREQLDASIGITVSQCFAFCKSKGIEDDRSIRGMLTLMMDKKVYTVDAMPEGWLTILNNSDVPGHYRAETLLKQELGHIPR